MLTFYNCDFDTTKSLPFKTCVQHGEDCQFQINIKVGGVPAASLSGYAWTAVYQDVSCLSVYYTVDAEDVSWNSQTNAVDFYFRHKYDMGAIAYRIFVYGTQGEENTVPAVIELGMLPNPIFSATHVEPVPPTLDFSQYNLDNAPWTDLSDFYALSAEVKQDMANYLPLSGGTINGEVYVGSLTAGELHLDFPVVILEDGRGFEFPSESAAPEGGTLALTSDIPSLDGYARESYVDQNLSGKLDKTNGYTAISLATDEEEAGLKVVDVVDGFWAKYSADGIEHNYPFGIPHSLEFPGKGGTLALTSDIPSVPVSSVNGKTGNVVLSAESVSALPAMPYTQQGYTNTWQLPQNATIIPNGQLDIKASNVIVPSIRSADNSNALLVPNGQGSEDWVARRSDIVNSDWNAISGTAEILNKPNIIPVTIDARQKVYTTTTDVQQLVVANSDQSKFAYLFAPQDPSDTRTAYIGTNGIVQAAKLQTSSGTASNPLTIPAGADANDAVARTSDLPPFETWTFELNDSTTVTKKVCIYN